MGSFNRLIKLKTLGQAILRNYGVCKVLNKYGIIMYSYYYFLMNIVKWKLENISNIFKN